MTCLSFPRGALPRRLMRNIFPLEHFSRKKVRVKRCGMVRDGHRTLSPLRPHAVLLMEDAATVRNIRAHRGD
jgi:hypothetical protein